MGKESRSPAPRGLEVIASPTPADLARLVVIFGGSPSRVYDLRKRVTTIGRTSTSDICVDHDSVSRTHAIVLVDERGVRVRDDASTNGTYVNEHRVDEAYLRNGVLIKIGRWVFRY